MKKSISTAKLKNYMKFLLESTERYNDEFKTGYHLAITQIRMFLDDEMEYFRCKKK